MDDNLNKRLQVKDAYAHSAAEYDPTLRQLGRLSQFGFDLSGWRQQAVDALQLKAGDTVVDIGCGTGLNFPLLQAAVGPTGKIIGIDLSPDMLAQAREMADQNGWENLELVEGDATTVPLPDGVDGILSTYVMILVPEAGGVIERAAEALKPNGRLAILDMAWPRWCPLWWRHVLFFLKQYGVTKEVLLRREWDAVQRTMHACCQDVTGQTFWFGFFYLTTGRVGPL